MHRKRVLHFCLIQTNTNIIWKMIELWIVILNTTISMIPRITRVFSPMINECRNFFNTRLIEHSNLYTYQYKRSISITFITRRRRWQWNFQMDFFTTPRTPLFIFSQSETELFLVLGADECANDWKTCRDNNFGAINPPVNESRASHDLLIFSFGEKQVVQYM